VLTVADPTLSVSPGGTVSLGIGVSVPHAGDNVTVNIAGLPKYETITDNLDHKTFSGSSITLTAAEVNSGLTLDSNYKGHGHPTATLMATATDNTGTPVTSAAQSIVVKDPPATTAPGTGTGTGSSGGVTPPVVTAPPGTGASGGATPPVVTSPPGTGASGGAKPPVVTSPPGTGASGGAKPPVVTSPPGTGASGGATPPVVTSPPGTGASGGATPPVVTSPPTSGGSTGTSGCGSSSHGGWPGQWGHGHHIDVSQWFDSHPDFAKTAKTLGAAFGSKSPATAAGSSTDHTASGGDKAFALFNQMMAGDFGKSSHFAQGGSSAAQSQQQTSNILTRPLH
jgi:hypothetical protein